MLLMLEKLKRLNAQAEHLDAKTGDVIGDFAKVTTGSVSSDDMAAKYAQTEAAMNTIASDMDPEADPCQDLYAYSCGRWINNTAIPSDRYSWSKTFSAIDRQNAAISLEIVSSSSLPAPCIPTNHSLSSPVSLTCITCGDR
jgi:predicted metalloendopeptidase